MPESKSDARLRFRVEAFDAIARGLGLTTEVEKARFLGVDPSNYSRVSRGITRPSEQFVADAMNATADLEDVGFEQLFEVEVTR